MKNLSRTLIIYTILLTGASLDAHSQENICFSSDVKTLQVKANGAWGEAPVILLAQGHHVDISFDFLQPEYQRFSYSITHCNADWQQSELITSEYMTGFNDSRIEDYEPAIGTEMNYCHYTLSLPNDDNQILVSGNYKVSIFDEDDNEVAQACFSVIEPKVTIDMSVSANTDIDTYDAHQQLSFAVNYRGLQSANPVSEFKYIVMQNRRWDTHVSDIKPSYMQVNKLIFDHNRALIFYAGNEYRRFEMLDAYTPTMRVDRMEFDDTYYHAYLFVDEQRTNYLYDEDQNGRFLLRNSDDTDTDTSCDYFMTHFTLQMPPVAEGDVYLYGDLTNNRIDPNYKMEYNIIDHQYELTIPLKQGAYNYMYLTVPNTSATPLTRPCEGDFHQTENEYDIYVYPRPFGQRYDRLVGHKSINFKE